MTEDFLMTKSMTMTTRKWCLINGNGLNHKEKLERFLTRYLTEVFGLPYRSKIGKPEHILRSLRPQDEVDFENSLIKNLTKEDNEDNFPFQIDALPSIERIRAKKNIDGFKECGEL